MSSFSASQVNILLGSLINSPPGWREARLTTNSRYPHYQCSQIHPYHLPHNHYRTEHNNKQINLFYQKKSFSTGYSGFAYFFRRKTQGFFTTHLWNFKGIFRGKRESSNHTNRSGHVQCICGLMYVSKRLGTNKREKCFRIFRLYLHWLSFT